MFQSLNAKVAKDAKKDAAEPAAAGLLNPLDSGFAPE
jgi:hypothetical protein